MIQPMRFWLPFVVAYLATFQWMWASWNFRDAYYSHAPIVVALGAFLVYQRRDRWASLPERLDARGWWLLGPGLLLHLIGAGLTVDSLSAASLCLSLPGLVWLTQGAGRTKALLPILGLVFFVVPMPLYVTGRVVFELKEFAVDAGLGLANLFGLGATRVGADLSVPGADAPLVVADACGGLRSLLSLTTLGYGLAFLMGSQRGARPWVLLAFAGPIAIATNIFRIAALCWMAHGFGSEFASGTGHDVTNVLIWVVDLALLLLIDRFFDRSPVGSSMGGSA